MSRQTSGKRQKSQGTFWNIAEFSARLRAERGRLGLNQAEFGALAGATLDSQSRYELAKNQPNAEYLAGLAAKGVDILFLLTGLHTDSGQLDADASALLDDFFALDRIGRRLAGDIMRTIRANGDDVQVNGSAEPSGPGNLQPDNR